MMAAKVKTITKTAVADSVSAVGVDLGDRWRHWRPILSQLK